MLTLKLLLLRQWCDRSYGSKLFLNGSVIWSSAHILNHWCFASYLKYNYKHRFLLIMVHHWIWWEMKCGHRSYRLRKKRTSGTLDVHLLWIIPIWDQTTHTRNATYIKYHFGLSKKFGDKMIEEKINNDFKFEWRNQKMADKWADFSYIRYSSPIMHQADNRPYMYFIISNIKFWLIHQSYNL